MRIEPHKVISAIILGVLVGLRIHYDYMKWNHIGRAAFLEHEGQRFDRFINPPHPAAFSIFGAIIALLIAVAVYELLALGVARIFKTSASETPGSR